MYSHMELDESELRLKGELIIGDVRVPSEAPDTSLLSGRISGAFPAKRRCSAGNHSSAASGGCLGDASLLWQKAYCHA